MREFHKRQEGRITFTINPTFLPTERAGPYGRFSKVNPSPTQETDINFNEVVGTVKNKVVRDPKPAWAEVTHKAAVSCQQHG